MTHYFYCETLSTAVPPPFSPPLHTSPFSLPQYSFLQFFPTQHSQPHQPLSTLMFCKTNPLHPSPYFAYLSLSLHAALPTPLLSPLLSAPFLLLYLHFLTHPADSKGPLALPVLAIALHKSVQFCPSRISYSNRFFDTTHSLRLHTYPKTPSPIVFYSYSLSIAVYTMPLSNTVYTPSTFSFYAKGFSPLDRLCFGK